MIKVLLINPNYNYFPGIFEKFVGYKSPPLGLTYIAAHIRKSHPVCVEICDAAALNLDEKAVAVQIRRSKPNIIGITATTLTAHYARQVSLYAKESNPEALIVLGGPHVSALPFENLDIADICVIGEGEAVFSEIVASVLNQGSLEQIKGIAFKKGAKYIVNDRHPLIQDLNMLPLPARDLLPSYTFRHIFPYRLDNPYYDTIITSRGCEYDCDFCASKLIWNGMTRYRDMDNVFMEIDELVNKYHRSFLFIRDDNFLLKTERVMEFCRRKRKNFPELKWMCHARADALSPELLEEMENSECLEIQIGVESGDDTVLKGCNKMVRTEVIHNAFRMIRKTKINSWATFIIGNAGETRDTVCKTIEFAKRISPTYCSFLFLSPLPGSKCFESMTKGKQITTYDWSKYSWHGDPVFETELLSKKMLKDLRKKAYRSFYLRPSKLFEYFWVMVREGQIKVVFTNFIILIKFLFGWITK